ncbi:TetR/AcrR family transcriptional regulator [Dactylosporangium sp. CA-092794]|uniref:TetR/AcrR family transcriptional regulator n=1 Tax=Dactylosporangium sp. CA-092794 TaxID=3239929 RepID=UPI003D92D78B
MTKIRSKQQLIEAAAKVFTEKGYEAARIEDIGAELGVLQGSLYYHIGSKAGLLRLVLRHRFNDITERIEGISQSSDQPPVKLRQAIEAQLHYVDPHLPEFPQWFSSPAATKETKEEVEHDRQLIARFRGSWQNILTEGIESGDVRDTVDPSIAVLSILGMCNTVARWHDWADERSPDEIADLQFDMIWAGIAAAGRQGRSRKLSNRSRIKRSSE